MSKYEYVPDVDSDLGKTREVEGIVYHPSEEAKIYRALGIVGIGTVYVDDIEKGE